MGYSGPHVPENGTNQYRYNKLQEYVRALCNGHYDWSIDSNNPNKGKSRYDVGYSDGQFLSLWISSRVGTIKYYVPIPFSYGLDNSIRNPLNEKKRYSALPRDCPINGFDRSYWHGWIDGVLSVVDDYRVGFYWSYESCLQATKHDPNFVDYFGPMCNANTKEYVDDYITFIRDMFRYIHNRGQELIWIPATGGRGVSYLNDPDYDGIPKIGGYFDYVFVQPNYYQYSKRNERGITRDLPYTYEKLVEKTRWIYKELPRKIKEQNPNSTTTVSIEMEADSAVLLGQRGHCALCKYENHHYVCDNEKCLERACDYYRAIREVSPTAFPTRAYYFGTDFEVIDRVRERCPGW
ncbi:DUF4855 domain-containing protein [Thermococcus aciditolerans]|uniref:DUF4855 domain-containing protein n=1 Tax=Thermococcus aciditolerans TaxID=2598455 RepID=UPI001FE4F9B7|nr:DUF4855 domain-containing protein [Thermococcus aciditolerans]